MSESVDQVPPDAPLRVLVVDDSVVDNRITCAVIARHGHTTFSAANGREAVELCRVHSPDLIVTDCNMPEMDGFQATRHIREVHRDRWVPIIMVSGMDAPEDIVRGLEAGADDFLTKPVHPDVLLAKLRLFRHTLWAHRQLKASYAHYRSISASALDGIITTNQDGVILTANRAAEQQFHSPAGGLLGRCLDEFLVAVAARGAAGWRQWADHGDGGYEGTGRRIDGGTFPLTLRVSNFETEGGGNFVVIVRDETLRKQHERSLETYRQEKQRESELAAEVMRNIIRADGAADPLLSVHSLPTSEFSGDMVLAARTPAHVPYFFVADATGHGLSAAICVLPLVRIFRTMVAKECALVEIAYEMNRHLHDTLPTGFFVAAVLARLDRPGRTVEVWNGGLPRGFLAGAEGDIREIESTNLPLGILAPEEFRADVQRQSWSPGSRLVVYTDGLNEACNADGEEFGRQRLLDLLRESAGAETLPRIVAAYTAFLGGAMPADDVTIVVAGLP
ncbi:MAG: SpoIIE family protein phosphatase [Gammaproteobacteria bacterium]